MKIHNNLVYFFTGKKYNEDKTQLKIMCVPPILITIILTPIVITFSPVIFIFLIINKIEVFFLIKKLKNNSEYKFSIQHKNFLFSKIIIEKV